MTALSAVLIPLYLLGMVFRGVLSVVPLRSSSFLAGRSSVLSVVPGVVIQLK